MRIKHTVATSVSIAMLAFTQYYYEYVERCDFAKNYLLSVR